MACVVALFGDRIGGEYWRSMSRKEIDDLVKSWFVPARRNEVEARLASKGGIQCQSPGLKAEIVNLGDA